MNDEDKVEPGISLFDPLEAGEEADHEDEEDLEDQRRRQAELQSLIANAFDDMGFDERTINSSCAESNMSSCSQNEEVTAGDQKNKTTELSSSEQLEVLYNVCIKENQTLSKELDSLKVEIKSERDEATRKLILLEAECRSWKTSAEQAKQVLADKSEEIQNKELQIIDLNSQLEGLAQQMKKLERELQNSKSNTMDLEQKNKYEAEIQRLLISLETYESKLKSSEQACRKLQEKINEDALLHERVQKANTEVFEVLQEEANVCNVEKANMLMKIAGLEKKLEKAEKEKNSSDPHSSTKMNQLLRCSYKEKHALRQEIVKLREHVDNLESDMKFQSNYVERCKEVWLAEHNENLTALKNQADQMLTENIRLQTEIHELKDSSQSRKLDKHQEDDKMSSESVRLAMNLADCMEQNRNLIEIIDSLSNAPEKSADCSSVSTQTSVSIHETSALVHACRSSGAKRRKLDAAVDEISILGKRKLTSSATFAPTNRHKFFKLRGIKTSDAKTQTERLYHTRTLGSQTDSVSETVSQATQTERKPQTRSLGVQTRPQRRSLSLPPADKIFMVPDEPQPSTSRASVDDPRCLQKLDECIETYHRAEYYKKETVNARDLIKKLKLKLAEANRNCNEQQYDFFENANKDIQSTLQQFNKNNESYHSQIEVLLKENSGLKEKIIFDRNAFSELHDIWKRETSILTETLQSLGKENKLLSGTINAIIKDSKKREEACHKLNEKIYKISEYIHYLEASSQIREKEWESKCEAARSANVVFLQQLKERIAAAIKQTEEWQKGSTNRH